MYADKITGSMEPDQSWSINNEYHLNSFDLSEPNRIEATVASSNLVWCILIE